MPIEQELASTWQSIYLHKAKGSSSIFCGTVHSPDAFFKMSSPHYSSITFQSGSLPFYHAQNTVTLRTPVHYWVCWDILPSAHHLLCQQIIDCHIQQCKIQVKS